MANPVSFDITSGVDIQEVDNAVNQARKEVAQRYDFKGSRAAIDLNRDENTLTLIADDDFKMNALWEILQGRLVRRGVPTKNLTPGEIERAANDTVRRVVTLQQGIPTEAAKEIVKFLKDQKLKKVQAAIQADQVRVSSASKDDLQEAIRAAARARLRRRAAVRQLPRLSGMEASMAGTCTRARREHPARWPPAIGTPQRRSPPAERVRRVNADAKVMADFEARVKAYATLHRKLEATLPEPAERDRRREQIDAHQMALARLIAHARPGAKPGDIFTQETRALFRR